MWCQITAKNTTVPVTLIVCPVIEQASIIINLINQVQQHFETMPLKIIFKIQTLNSNYNHDSLNCVIEFKLTTNYYYCQIYKLIYMCSFWDECLTSLYRQILNKTSTANSKSHINHTFIFKLHIYKGQ